MKNDNKGWLFWGFIGLVILNVILLAYIVVGMNKADIRLSPADCIGGTIDSRGYCILGDVVDGTIINLKDSRIRRGIGANGVMYDGGALTFLAGKDTNGIKMTGVDASGNEKQTNVLINGNLKLMDKMEIKNSITIGEIDNFRSKITAEGLYFLDPSSSSIKSDSSYYATNALNIYSSALRTSFLIDPSFGGLKMTDSGLDTKAIYKINGVYMQSPDKKYWKCAPDNTGNWKCDSTGGF